MSKVKPGQPWKPERALDANAKSTAADFHRRSNQNIDGQRDRQFDVDGNVVYVRNTSAEDTDRGDVLALANTPADYRVKLLTKADREQKWLAADIFTTATIEATPVLCIDPIPAGEIGPAQVDGAGVAMVNVTNLSHTHATPTKDELYFTSSLHGPARLLHKPDATGMKLCIVLLERDPRLRGGCLAEDHPGRGIVFDLTLGTWDSAQTKWLYDVYPDVKAIDWRYGVPYPDAGATGLFHPKASDTYGTIWECVSLDCESPGACVSE